MNPIIFLHYMLTYFNNVMFVTRLFTYMYVLVYYVFNLKGWMIIKGRDIVETKAMVKNDRVRKTNLLPLKGRMTLLKAFTKDG